MLSVVKDLRKLHGGSQPHLMQASDGNYYIVKFQGNPQGTKVLANELLASRLAELLKLPVPRAETIELPKEIATQLEFQTPAGNCPVRPGLHCGIRVVISPLNGRMYEILPTSEQRNLRNWGDLIGVQVFDLWTLNIDWRQQIFWRRSAEKEFRVSFIDNGHCFGGPGWKMVANPLQVTAQCITSEASEWINRIEHLGRNELTTAASEIPPEWYGYDTSALRAMLDVLLARCSTLRMLARIADLRHGNRSENVYACAVRR